MYGATLARDAGGKPPAAPGAASAALRAPGGRGPALAWHGMAGRLAAIGLGGAPSPTPSPIAGLLARRTPPSSCTTFAASMDAGGHAGPPASWQLPPASFRGSPAAAGGRVFTPPGLNARTPARAALPGSHRSNPAIAVGAHLCMGRTSSVQCGDCKKKRVKCQKRLPSASSGATSRTERRPPQPLQPDGSERVSAAPCRVHAAHGARNALLDDAAVLAAAGGAVPPRPGGALALHPPPHPAAHHPPKLRLPRRGPRREHAAVDAPRTHQQRLKP